MLAAEEGQVSSRLGWVATVALLVASGAWGAQEDGSGVAGSAAERAAHLKVQLPGAEEEVDLERGESGGLEFVVALHDGRRLRLDPEAFAALVYREQGRFTWWNRLLNVTSPIGVAWVGLGFLGQLLFSGRMLVQWLVSEREHRSVVPPVFWWLSLAGASMLIVYFVWRKDIVGTVGQATGWAIYLRNLWLIYRSGSRSPGDLAPQPPPPPRTS